MKLEAKDRLNPNLVCVATIADLKNKQVLISFDGWSNRYSYWCDTTSEDIHPAGWCSKHGYGLQPPNDYGRRPFKWDVYLLECDAEAVPDNTFTSSQLQK